MKKLISILGVLLVLILLVTGSCARESTVSQEKEVAIGRPTSVPMPPPSEETSGIAYEEAASKGEGGATEERMIVRYGNMSLIADDVVDRQDEIAQLAVGLGGYVVSSWISGEGKEMRGNISIRVPDEKFELTLAELRDLAVRVESENTNSQDITEQYIDLEGRLKNAEATESQYLTLLDKAKDVDDIILIYDYLSRVRREIEQIKGQMQYLERTSSMSLITVQLQPAATAKPLVPVGWSALETLKTVIRGIVIFGQWLVTIIIWLAILLPIWGTIVGIILWRRHQRGKVQTEPPPKKE